jgi:predicted nucleic acid-binding protein
LLIAALNRGDRHHRWAVESISYERRRRRRIVVPEPVVGEAFTKLRYDRRVSGRRDARPALALFGLLEADPDLFDVRGLPADSYVRTRDLLTTYADQPFSYVDAIVLLTVDDEHRADRLLTVDQSFASYRFGHRTVVAVPAS